MDGHWSQFVCLLMGMDTKVSLSACQWGWILKSVCLPVHLLSNATELRIAQVSHLLPSFYKQMPNSSKTMSRFRIGLVGGLS